MQRDGIYISGPMRGIKDWNREAFKDAQREAETWWEGVVYNPHELDEQRGNLKMEAIIAQDIDLIIKRCKAILLLEGWEKSIGARAEACLAQWLELDFYYDSPVVFDIKYFDTYDHTECEEESEDILLTALNLTQGDRQAQYGPPDQDFARTASMWKTLFGWDVSSRQVALAMICLKLSRETHQRKQDNLIDIAGYARCASLCK
jgi:hypothetical protein